LQSNLKSQQHLIRIKSQQHLIRIKSQQHLIAIKSQQHLIRIKSQQHLIAIKSQEISGKIIEPVHTKRVLNVRNTNKELDKVTVY